MTFLEMLRMCDCVIVWLWEAPRPIILYFEYTKLLQLIPGELPNHFSKILFLEYWSLEMLKCWEMCAPHIRQIRVWGIVTLWIFETFKVGNFEPLKLWNFRTLECWDFETLELRDLGILESWNLENLQFLDSTQ